MNIHWRLYNQKYKIETMGTKVVLKMDTKTSIWTFTNDAGTRCTFCIHQPGHVLISFFLILGQKTRCPITENRKILLLTITLGNMNNDTPLL